MTYTLQAIIAKTDALPGALPDKLKPVPLRGGMSLIPIGTDALKTYGFAFCPLTDDGQEGLPQEISELCRQLSIDCQPA
ncbi:MAG: hypothetical protein JO142_19115 [Burkholderiales bacterium]|nr:hypothetical protein [Burkholderiales bacterium]